MSKKDTEEKRDKSSADISVVRLTLHMFVYASKGRKALQADYMS